LAVVTSLSPTLYLLSLTVFPLSVGTSWLFSTSTPRIILSVTWYLRTSARAVLLPRIKSRSSWGNLSAVKASFTGPSTEKGPGPLRTGARPALVTRSTSVVSPNSKAFSGMLAVGGSSTVSTWWMMPLVPLKSLVPGITLAPLIVSSPSSLYKTLRAAPFIVSSALAWPKLMLYLASGTTWCNRMEVRSSLSSRISSRLSILAKASFVGAKMVNGPAPLRVSTSSAIPRAVTRVLSVGMDRATSTTSPTGGYCINSITWIIPLSASLSPLVMGIPLEVIISKSPTMYLLSLHVFPWRVGTNMLLVTSSRLISPAVTWYLRTSARAVLLPRIKSRIS